MNGKPRPGDAPPVLQRVRAGQGAGRSGAEVTAAAAIAAGLPHQGSLASDAPLRLLYLAAAASASGRLEIETEHRRFELHLKRGVIAHAASDEREEGLVALLVARGIVTAGALADAERIRGEFGGDVLSALASLRLLDPAHAYTVLQEHGTAVVARALAARQGSWRWDPRALPPASAFPLGSRWGILCDAARRLDGDAARQLLGDRAARVAARSGGRVELSQLKLTAREARAAAALFAGTSTPLQLAAAQPAESSTTLTVALLLAETELLAFGAHVSSGPEPTPPGPAPGGRPADGGRPVVPVRSDPVARITPVPFPVVKAPVASPAATAASAIDEAELEAFHARIVAGDHFEALGVKREATTSQIKVAYFQLAKRYHPDAGLAGEPPGVKKLRADIFARIGEAWRVLGDEAGRSEYLRCLESGGAVEVDVSAILKAEELFRKAIIQVKGRQYDSALATLQEATALNPDEPEFAVWTAWVRFLLAGDRAGQHRTSAEAIEKALEMVPRCIPGYLFLGQMAKLMGDLGAAERHLKRGLALHPDAADLARELKYLRK